MLTVGPDDAVPDSCELYVIGGGEDLLRRWLPPTERRPPLHRAVESGLWSSLSAPGSEILGQSFVGVDGKACEGLGLLDCVTVRPVCPEP